MLIRKYKLTVINIVTGMYSIRTIVNIVITMYGVI